MKKFFMIFMIFLLVPIAHASVEFTGQLNNEYNLGDDIKASLKIIPEANANALVKLTLKCADKEVPYYIAPAYLEQAKETLIDAPSIKAFSTGLCNVIANVNSLEGASLGEAASNNFSISDRLELSFSVDKTDVLPGDVIKVEGSASKRGEAVENGKIMLRLDNSERQITPDGIGFSYNLKLEKNIKSGEHKITIEASDDYGNSNSMDSAINVRAVPTTLRLDLNKKEFLPNEKMTLTTELLDQANDTVAGNVNLKLSRRRLLLLDEIVIFDTSAEANKEFSFTFNSSTAPEEYTLKCSFGGLEKEDRITILPYQKIEMKLDGYVVVIKNTGNIKYNNDTTILVEKDGKTYFVNKNVNLDVGEEMSVDLSKEVSAGTYTVVLPPGSSEDKVVERVVEKVVEKEAPTDGKEEVAKEGADENIGEEVTSGEENVIENVKIEDNRPFYKRGLSMITGGVIAGAGVLLSRPKTASFLMMFILIAVVYYFSKNKIKKIIEKIREKRIKNL